ncbi:MAG: polyphosphate kinase 1 [Acidimicrobiia bacterium]|nr:polyphosphate kinase 1 [Acidimicrobiia bacterium]
MMDPSHYLNREMSLLDFQERVLELAEQPDVPLLERLKFLAIVSQNLDEFFQVRVAGLKEQANEGITAAGPDGVAPRKSLEAIRVRALDLTAQIDAIFHEQLHPALAAAGVEISAWSDLDEAERKVVTRIFETEIFPVLTPLAVDPSHPFPYISNLSVNLGVVLSHWEAGRVEFARVKVPPILPRFIQVGENDRFVPIEQVIAANLGQLFPGMNVLSHHMFRVTRNADLAVEEAEANDLLEAMESVLRFRQRFAAPVRLEVAPETSDHVLALLQHELELGPDDVYVSTSPLGLGALWSLYGLDRPDLKDDPWKPTTQPRLDESSGDIDMFKVLSEGDVLIHHPYESFATSTSAFLAQAAADPDVLAIKQTLYRTWASEDPAIGGEEEIVRHLIEAALSGKQVVVLVELKARFDEEANINWARMLEASGAHVVYGVKGLKTHSKILLVVRREPSGLKRYSHIGTGNYNPKTARIYEDIGILTSDPDIGDDLSRLFNELTGYSGATDFRKILVAPRTLRPRLLERIREEAAKGSDGSIVFKINHLVDPEIIESLYDASSAGCQVQLVVRGVCSLIPGVPGMSENITVRSILGRFLEHSRIYRFGQPSNGAVYYTGSADLMPRNLNGRVEVVVAVTAPSMQARIEEILSIALAEDTTAWVLGPDGTWTRSWTPGGTDLQNAMQERALTRWTT